MKTLVVQEHPENGNLFFVLPLEVLNQVGWCEGDVLQWFDNHDGSWRIEKKHEEDKAT
jgi:hypothetical protein